MCYAYGSIEQATGVCPMCEVFKPSAARCPHIRDVCQNRTLHPAHDVVYLKNAEVQSFNGCGFCKWAKTKPPQEASGYHNPGYPGCCRPPAENELNSIPAADWRAVSIVHRIPIPPETKALLDTLAPKHYSPFASGSGRTSAASYSSPQPSVGKYSSSGSPLTKNTPLTKSSSPVTIPLGKGRQGGSPQLITSSLSGGNPRGHQSGLPSSVPNPSLDRRRQEHGDKRVCVSRSSHPSPTRKQAESDTAIPKRSATHRSSTLHASPSNPTTKLAADIQAPPLHRHRSLNANSVSAAPRAPSHGGRQPLAITVEPQDPRELSVIPSPSSDGSVTDSTVTSDGGFTDYLSEDSEEELQRQAEARAIIIAQSQAEEQEFKAARQQLANVDLRPPKSWNNTRSR